MRDCMVKPQLIFPVWQLSPDLDLSVFNGYVEALPGGYYQCINGLRLKEDDFIVELVPGTFHGVPKVLFVRNYWFVGDERCGRHRRNEACYQISTDVAGDEYLQLVQSGLLSLCDGKYRIAHINHYYDFSLDSYVIIDKSDTTHFEIIPDYIFRQIYEVS